MNCMCSLSVGSMLLAGGGDKDLQRVVIVLASLVDCMCSRTHGSLLGMCADVSDESKGTVAGCKSVDLMFMCADVEVVMLEAELSLLGKVAAAADKQLL